jgi:hypothetical protein
MIDRHAEAIDRLRIHRLLSESEVWKARHRLIAKIQKEVKLAKKPNTQVRRQEGGESAQSPD